ncbi:MAG: hypothetical protein K5679_02680 [Lachnospiraceae bacterium]|nr:hypothetical protein [Lachnospiraceae bacterium]
MKKMVKSALVLFFIFLSFVVTSCDKDNSLKGKEKGIAIADEYVYTKIIVETDKSLIANAAPFSFKLSEKYLYFYEVKHDDDADGHQDEIVVKRIPIESGNSCEEVFFTDSEILDYSVRTINGRDVISTVSESADGYVIKRYDSSEKTESKVTFKNAKNYKRPDKIEIYEDKYVLVCDTKGVYVDENGKVTSTFNCPSDRFLKLTVSDEGVTYAVYRIGREVFLGKFVEGSEKVISEVNLPFSVDGLCIFEGNPLITDGKELYSCYLESGECTRIANLLNYDILLGDIGYSLATGDNIYLLNTSLVYKDFSPKIVKMSKTDRIINAADKDTDVFGKKIIRLYSSSEELRQISISDEMIVDFNLSSEKYRVEVVKPKERGTLKDIEEDGIIPDVLLIYWCNDIEKYANNGYLSNLWPLIEEYSTIEKEDIHKSVIQNFEYGDKLYAFPMFLSAYTIMLKKSDAEGKSGWTTMEFLDWLNRHKDIYVNFFAGKQEILDCCVDGSLDSYVDFKTGKVSFDNSDFGEVLEKIKNLELTHADKFVVTNPFIEDASQYDGDSVLFISLLSDLNAYAQYEIMMGEEAVNMGLPSSDRGMKAISRPYSNLAVYEKSECKEGAIEFIEFCLRHGNDKYSDYETVSKGRVASLYSEQENGFDDLIGTYKDYAPGLDYTVTKEQAERLKAIFENVVPDSKEREEIRGLIAEEAQAYFEGAVSLEDTVRKIQSRVSIMVLEGIK